jgi:MPBQ/MSBQ methyltransferase
MVRDEETAVADHYNVAGLMKRITDTLERAGVDPEAPNPLDLAPVDEFHMGGRAATAHVAELMNLAPDARVLDVGSGLGGPARFLAAECGCFVSGIDITPEFVSVARMLSERTGLATRVEFRLGSALDLPWPDATFDGALTFHAAMNISDRPRLYSEVARVVRFGSIFAIYDVMKGPEEGMVFPVPWAETADTSFLVTPLEMETLLGDAGFDIIRREDRSELALRHHRMRIAELSAADGPPALGIHLLTGDTAALKSSNMIAMLEANQITLGIIIARRRD